LSTFSNGAPDGEAIGSLMRLFGRFLIGLSLEDGTRRSRVG